MQTQYSGACAVDLESKAPREAPSFPLLPFVKKILQKKTKITEGWNSSSIASFFNQKRIHSIRLVMQNQYSGACAVDLESKATREAPSFPLLPFVKKIFTEENEDNGGLEQLLYRILF